LAWTDETILFKTLGQSTKRPREELQHLELLAFFPFSHAQRQQRQHAAATSNVPSATGTTQFIKFSEWGI
jgi:hypothetical protein